MYSVTVGDGKYTVSHNNGRNLNVTYYDEPYGDIVDHRLVLALVQKIDELENKIEGLEYEVRGDDD